MSNDCMFCQNCSGVLKRYDSVKRLVKKQGQKTEQIRIERYQCTECKRIYRILPDIIYPYKQYEAEIIDGVREGFITSDTLGFEDYPSEPTMKRWIQEWSDNKD